MACPRSPEIQQVQEQQSPKPSPPPTFTALLLRQKSAPPAVPGLRSSSGGFSLRSLVCMPSLTSSAGDHASGQRRRGKEPVEADHYTPGRLGGRGGGLSWGSRMAIGERDAMEDYCANVRGLMKVSCPEFGGCSAPLGDHAGKKAPVHYFGVFDGHRGHQVSEYCANLLHDLVVEEWEKQASEDLIGWPERWRNAFSRAFERADETFRGRTLEVRFAGSTASVVVVSPCQIIASNCGDSKIILCRSKEVIPLTFDHKPNRKEEVDRIEKVGGKILRINGLRVEGVLAMTRAIGDHDLKPFVISTPDVTFTKRSSEDECLVLATDGLWDVMSIEMVAKFARNRLRAYRSVVSSLMPATAVAEDLVHKALINSSQDNITVTVVDLKPLWRSKKCY